MALGQSEPLKAWQWDIRSARLMTCELPWPDGQVQGDRSVALDAWGFQQEFVTTPLAQGTGVETGVQANVYSRFLAEDDQDKGMPFHYCIVLEMSTVYELVFAADLPELVDALRYLAPLTRS
jgi:hypothetical protein